MADYAERPWYESIQVGFLICPKCYNRIKAENRYELEVIPLREEHIKNYQKVRIPKCHRCCSLPEKNTNLVRSLTCIKK